MNRFFRFSARLALTYIALSVLVLALFAIRLWYSWRVNLSTLRAYVHGESLQRSVVESFWYGIAGAIGIVVVPGAFSGWMIRRALLFEVQEISGTASANQ